MGLGAIIGSALEAARAATESVQVTVSHERRTGQDLAGEPRYAAPVPRAALVGEGSHEVHAADGRVLVVRAVVAFLPEAEGQPPPEVGRLDRVTLPSGLKGIVAELPESMLNPSTGLPFARTAWLV